MLSVLSTLSLLIACNDSSNNDSTTNNILPLGDSITEGVPFTYRYPLYNMLSDERHPFDFVGSHTDGGWDYPEEGWDRDHEGWSGWTTQSIEEELLEWSSQYLSLIHI